MPLGHLGGHPTPCGDSPRPDFNQKWFPFSTANTYATSGEAIDEMMRLQSLAPDVPMRVRPVEKDINASYVYPGKPTDQKKYGKYPTWGELKRKLPDLSEETAKRA